MPLKIGIDLDNVVISTTRTLCNYINERLPVNLKMEDITTYSIEEALPEQYRWIVEAGFRDKTMWKGVELIPHAALMMELLYKEGHKLYFITSSLPENLYKKINHLSRNLVFLPDGYVFKHTINTQDKSMLNVDILVDDCLGHAIHPERRYWSIVMDYPWNQIDKPVPCLSRAKNWIEAYHQVHEVESLIKEDDNDDVTP
jgi:5'(3')-deoxyribonucleotidase